MQRGQRGSSSQTKRRRRQSPEKMACSRASDPLRPEPPLLHSKFSVFFAFSGSVHFKSAAAKSHQFFVKGCQASLPCGPRQTAPSQAAVFEDGAAPLRVPRLPHLPGLRVPAAPGPAPAGGLRAAVEGQAHRHAQAPGEQRALLPLDGVRADGRAGEPESGVPEKVLWELATEKMELQMVQGVDLSCIGLYKVASLAGGQWEKHPRKLAQLYALERNPVEAAWPAGKCTARHQLHALCLLRGAHCGGAWPV